MTSLTEYRTRRLWASIPGIVLSGGAAMATALGTLLLASLTQPSTTSNQWLHSAVLWGLVGGVVITIALLIVQTRYEYRRRTYDPTWVLDFNAAFFSDSQMKKTRSNAAKSLKKNRKRLRDESYKNPDLDDVIDFFEDVGFYVFGDQIAPEVAHHSFHYWLRGYCSVAQPYIEMAQKTKPSQWECIGELLSVTQEVEDERSGSRSVRTLTEKGIDRFLNEEITLT